MQSEDFNTSLIQKKREYLETLMQRYQAAYAALTRELNESNKPIHQAQIHQLEQEIKGVQAEIKLLERSQRPGNEQYRQVSDGWERDLHHIDFDKAKKLLERQFKPLKSQSGASLLLMKKSGEMGGKWFAQKLKHQIREHLGNFVEPCEIGFLAHHSVSGSTFLDRLVERYPVSLTTSIAEREKVAVVINKILGSLVSGDIFLLHLEIHTLPHKNQFLEWFVKQFWSVLLSQLQSKPRVRFITFLSIQGAIPPGCLPSDLCCPKKGIDCSKILELPGQKWSKDDICNWLFSYSGLTRLPASLEEEHIQQMAQNIHTATGGVPIRVYQDLMNTMSQCLCQEG